ncbi:hypothetical protein [Massilia sp. TWP1-3-3]|uniref:hypothetical protein n=1 Tax=Massilia sp. TWP1-3-3 TaxID=2804573 RepID=UPI003CF2C482
MQELNNTEIDQVSGGDNGGAIALTLAGAWSGAVAGAAVGSIVPGIGTLGGAAFGFVFAGAVGIATVYATAS